METDPKPDTEMTFGQRWRDGAQLAIGVGFAAMCGAVLGLLGTGAVFIALEIFWRARDWGDVEDRYSSLGMIAGIAIFGPVFLSQAMDVLARGKKVREKYKGIGPF